MVYILRLAIELFSIILLASVVASWVAPNSRHPAKLFLERVTEPVLEPIRRVMPALGGFDLSPMIALLLLHALGRLI